jgi:ketosteroid isomerase-like protein
MSQDKVDALQRVYSGWERGDFSVGAELLTTDVFVTWEVPEGWITAHGQEELQQRMLESLEPWREFRIKAEEFIALNEDSVLVAQRNHARGKQSGAQLEQPSFSIWVFEGDKVAALYGCFDRDEALQAAGLSEYRARVAEQLAAKAGG